MSNILIELDFALKSIAKNRTYLMVVGNEDINKLIGCYNPSSFLAGFDYGMELTQTILSNIPTAYNVEKVIEQIHAYFCKETDARTDGLEEYPSGLISDLLKYNKEICEIVRKGGV